MPSGFDSGFDTGYGVSAVRRNATVEVGVDANLVQYGLFVVWTDRDTGYCFYRSAPAPELVYRKTTTGGQGWSSPILIDAAVGHKYSCG